MPSLLSVDAEDNQSRDAVTIEVEDGAPTAMQQHRRNYRLLMVVSVLGICCFLAAVACGRHSFADASGHDPRVGHNKVAFIPTASRYAAASALRKQPHPQATIVTRATEDKEEEQRPAKITLDGLRDLVSLGLGAPNLGTFKGVDKETGTLNFELDENRFITKDGKEYGSFDNSKGTYFESGEVDEDADFMGKLMGMFGGGKKKDA